ncbi:hypothetical protein HD806DRAFT_511104 [Xylariaceae sp. AK1471]|nr:hypothetical protein HD806DRAFT_511104 [Xylariaceae sp. AK1471]
MRYTALILSILGLSAMSMSAPTPVPNEESVTAQGEDSPNATEPALPAGADAKEEDTDDVFVYQWRQRE